MQKSIKPAKLSDAIAGHIEKLIREGGLIPGQRLLAERELSARLGVSCPSLREALGKLLAMGLLTTDVQGASYVSEALGSSFRDPLIGLLDDPVARFDYLEFRSIIEGTAACYAAERGSDIDMRNISDQFGRMQDAHARDDSDEHAKADADFHLAIYEASHNLVALHIMRSLESMLRSDVYLNRKRLS
jgi:GntR family transcriptional repressor for pyruvate dehydrogenase complex